LYQCKSFNALFNRYHYPQENLNGHIFLKLETWILRKAFLLIGDFKQMLWPMKRCPYVVPIIAELRTGICWCWHDTP